MQELEIQVEPESFVANINTDYEKLTNLPQVNGNELKGDLTLDQLGIQPKGDYAAKSEIPSLDGYAKTEDIEAEYAKKEEIKNFITEENVNTKLENYYNKQDIDNKGYLTEHQDISNLATKEEVKLKADKTDLDNYTDTKTLESTYATKQEIPDTKTFITKDVTDLTNYYDKDTTDEKINLKIDKNYVDDNFAKTMDIADFIKKDVSDLENYYDKTTIDRKTEDFVTKEVSDLTNYYSKTETYSSSEIDQKIKEASGTDLSAYLKKEEASETYLDKTTASETYATKDEIPDTKDFITETAVDTKLEDYYTKQDIDGKGYLTEHQDLTDYMKTADADLKYATKTEIGDFITESNVDTKLQDYVTNQALEEKHYLTEHQDISNLATKEEVNLKADKNYVDTNFAKTTDLPTKLSQLENDLLLKANSEEELITLSQQNPEKWVYTVQQEE